jgi:hypothetical protein
LLNSITLTGRPERDSLIHYQTGRTVRFMWSVKTAVFCESGVARVAAVPTFEPLDLMEFAALEY